MAEMQVISFVSGNQWEAWLSKYHATVEGIWLQFYKKDSGMQTISYPDALDVALCYGWIDGQTKTYDERSWLRKFTPRRPGSVWSKRNTEHAERLIKAGKMKAAGLLAIEAAKADGRWQQSYDSPKNTVIPEDFLKALEKNKKAKAFFQTLNKTNKYSLAWRLQTAKKPETRERRMKKMIEMLSRGEQFHS